MNLFLLLADVETVEGVKRMSYFEWFSIMLGPIYLWMILLSGVLVFGGACYLVYKYKRPAVIASFIPLLLLPFLIGLFDALYGMVYVLSVAIDSMYPPRVLDWQCLHFLMVTAASLLAGMFVSIPAYFVLSIGLLVRAIRADRTNS